MSKLPPDFEPTFVQWMDQLRELYRPMPSAAWLPT
jgi:hypothetical protein